MPVPKTVARARKAREKASLAIQSVLIREQISSWFSLCLLLHNLILSQQKSQMLGLNLLGQRKRNRKQLSAHGKGASKLWLSDPDFTQVATPTTNRKKKKEGASSTYSLVYIFWVLLLTAS